MLRRAGRSFGEETIDRVLQKCGRRNLRPNISNSIVSSRPAPFPGYALFIDIAYLREGMARRFPSLMILGAFSRFIVCAVARNLQPAHIISIIEIPGTVARKTKDNTERRMRRYYFSRMESVCGGE